LTELDTAEFKMSQYTLLQAYTLAQSKLQRKDGSRENDISSWVMGISTQLILLLSLSIHLFYSFFRPQGLYYPPLSISLLSTDRAFH
jgi:hypothetical protein